MWGGEGGEEVTDVTIKYQKKFSIYFEFRVDYVVKVPQNQSSEQLFMAIKLNTRAIKLNVGVNTHSFLLDSAPFLS